MSTSTPPAAPTCPLRFDDPLTAFWRRLRPGVPGVSGHDEAT